MRLGLTEHALITRPEHHDLGIDVHGTKIDAGVDIRGSGIPGIGIDIQGLKICGDIKEPSISFPKTDINISGPKITGFDIHGSNNY